ncbi:hypothetical protein, partial [Streptomyces sp. UH6]|uniref:hypothetical protein n=1 Tax=Streptomyces sp. UH6 TaxID=2748379 RepID=UPI0015D4B08A
IEEAEKGGTPEEDEGAEETPGGEDEQETPEKPAPEEPDPDEPGTDEPAPEEPGSEEPAPEEPAPGDAAPEEPAPEEEAEKPNLLEGIGDAIKDLLDGPGTTDDAAGTPEAEAPAEEEPAEADAPEKGAEAGTEGGKESEPAAAAPKDAVEETAKAVEEAKEEAEKEAEEPAEEETAEPAVDPEDCPVATDEEGGLEDIVALPDRAWELRASSLLLKGAKYEGVVKVKTANGTVKEVLKYVVSSGTDIGDLHQVVHDEQNGKTHHAVAGKGTTSTIRGGDTVMYTESISGNLLGLLPVTFSPENPPPLDIAIIYFTNVKVVQAGQFGGNLTIPGLRQYAD